LFEYRPTDGELSDLLAYLDSLAAPEPPPVPPSTRQVVERGRVVFDEQGKCSRCHQGETLQDGGRHDVGTGGEFDTPSLRGVGRRLPLLHDGRAVNAADLFQQHNGAKKHGAAHTLAHDDLTALLAYLGSL